MDPLPFLAPLSAYEQQAKALLASWQSPEPGSALDFFHDHHPRFRREDVAWLPKALSQEQLSRETFTHADAQLAIARSHNFLDWASLETWVRAIETRDPAVYPFESAVEAVIHGDAKTLKRLLRENPELVHARSTRLAPFDPPLHRSTLLHYIAANGVEGQRQMTPHNAVEIARILLDAGADPNSLADLYGGECTTLSLLVSSAHPAQAGLQSELAELLIDRGASVSATGSGNWTNPLPTALVFGYLNTARTLARKGAPVDTIVAAAGLGQTAKVQDMLPSASELDRHGAIAIATQLGHADVLRLLLDAGVDPNRYNPDGMHSHATPLHQAALAGHLDVVRMLVAHGARLDIEDKVYSGKPLDWALHGGQNEAAAILRAAMQ
jgi:ankyrin repeat protein